MIKHKLLYVILIFTLFVVGIAWFFVYPKFQKESSNNTTVSTVSLGGNYVLDTANPLQNSDIKILASSEKEISYNIDTVNFGHLGNLEGVAERVASSSLVYKGVIKSDTDDAKACSIVISFRDTNHLSYNSTGEACDEFHGAHGTFFNNDIHEKNGSVSLPTIEKLGFTKDDLVRFNNLFPAENNEGTLLEYAQEFINVEASIVKKITSPDISSTAGYLIETPNIYDGVSTCFPDLVGYCVFVAFMKDKTNNYWILEGSNAGDDFRYATNNLQWKKKLPRVFQSELDRIGISNGVVKLLP